MREGPGRKVERSHDAVRGQCGICKDGLHVKYTVEDGVACILAVRADFLDRSRARSFGVGPTLGEFDGRFERIAPRSDPSKPLRAFISCPAFRWGAASFLPAQQCRMYRAAVTEGEIYGRRSVEDWLCQ